MQQAPWTEVGRLQDQVRSLEYKLNQKVDSYEIHSTNSNVDSIKRECGEISSAFNELRHELQMLQDKVREIENA